MSATADAVLAALTPPPDGLGPGLTSTGLIEDNLTAWCDLLSTRNSGALFGRWRSHPAARGGWTEQPWGTQLDEQLLEDLRGTDFGKIEASRHRLGALAGAAAAMTDVGLADGLHGRVAEVARGRLDRFVVAARVWQDGLTQLATALEGAHSVVADGLRTWVDSLEPGALKDITVDDTAKRTRQIDRVDDAMSHGSLWGKTFSPDLLRTPGQCDLNLAPGQLGESWPSHEVVNYLDDFCARYDAVVGKFRRDLRDVHEATARAWLTLGDLARAVDTDPFARVTTGSAAASVTIREAGHAITVTPEAGGRTGLTVDGKQYVLGAQPEPVAQPEPAAQPAADPVKTDTAAPPAADSGAGSPGAGGGSGGGGGGGASALTGGGGGGGETPPAEGAVSGVQAMDDSEKSRSTAPAGAATGAPPAAAGGAPMGGGMGGAGAGQGGGDSERKASKWRLAGTLFDDRDPMASFDGVVGQDPAARRT